MPQTANSGTQRGEVLKANDRGFQMADMTDWINYSRITPTRIRLEPGDLATVVYDITERNGRTQFWVRSITLHDGQQQQQPPQRPDDYDPEPEDLPAELDVPPAGFAPNPADPFPGPTGNGTEDLRTAQAWLHRNGHARPRPAAVADLTDIGQNAADLQQALTKRAALTQAVALLAPWYAAKKTDPDPTTVLGIAESFAFWLNDAGAGGKEEAPDDLPE